MRSHARGGAHRCRRPSARRAAGATPPSALRHDLPQISTQAHTPSTHDRSPAQPSLSFCFFGQGWAAWRGAARAGGGGGDGATRPARRLPRHTTKNSRSARSWPRSRPSAPRGRGTHFVVLAALEGGGRQGRKEGGRRRKGWPRRGAPTRNHRRGRARARALGEPRSPCHPGVGRRARGG